MILTLRFKLWPLEIRMSSKTFNSFSSTRNRNSSKSSMALNRRWTRWAKKLRAKLKSETPCFIKSKTWQDALRLRLFVQKTFWWAQRCQWKHTLYSNNSWPSVMMRKSCWIMVLLENYLIERRQSGRNLSTSKKSKWKRTSRNLSKGRNVAQIWSHSKIMASLMASQ